MRMYDIAVIGFGAAGCKAALDSAYYNARTAVFTGDKESKRRARSTWVRHGNANVPGLTNVPTTDIIGNVRRELEVGPLSHNVRFFDEMVVNLEPRHEYFLITRDGGDIIRAKLVILALGATDEQPEIPKSSGDISKIFPYANGSREHPPSVHYCLRCDGHLVHGRNFAVIGHSPSAATVTKILAARSVVFRDDDSVTFRPQGYLLLHGEKPAFSSERAKGLNQIGVEVVPQSIVGLEGSPKAHRLDGFYLLSGRFVEVPVAFVALGMRNNETGLVGPLKRIGVKFDDLNAVLVDENNETAVKGIFALGDGVAGRQRQIYCHWADSLKIMRIIEQRLMENILGRLKD